MTAAYQKEILVGLDEDTVRKRKARVKSSAPMSTTSRIQVITNNPIEKTVPDKRYDDYHGSTRNDMLTLVSLVQFELKWNLPLKDKIQVYNGPESNRRVSTDKVLLNIMPTSSTCDNVYNITFEDGSAIDDLKAQEPVFHGGLPCLMWKNLFQAYGTKGIIDLSAGDGEICKASMLMRKPCLAFCLSDTHVRLLFDHLVSWMLSNMTDDKCLFYNSNYVKFKANERSGGTGPTPAPTPTKTPNKRSSEGGSENPKSKSKPKKAKPTPDPEESSSSDDEDADDE